MLLKYHEEILQQALGGVLSATALAKVTKANIYQDRVSAQLGHDEYHFDNNALEESHAYIEEQRAQVISALKENDAESAWAAFGRLTHTAQDFYSHTNYVDMWLARQPTGTSPTEIDPIDREILASPNLHSGKLYYPLELLSFIKIFRPLVMPLLPRDSHAWMNLDSPAQGFKIDYVMQASIKRTVLELEKTRSSLTASQLKVFLDQ